MLIDEVFDDQQRCLTVHGAIGTDLLGRVEMLQVSLYLYGTDKAAGATSSVFYGLGAIYWLDRYGSDLTIALCFFLLEISMQN